MAEHLAGERLGGPATNQVGKTTKDFGGITVDGECHWVDVIIGGLLISAAGAFNAQNPTGSSKKSRGGDDSDKLVDFIFNTLGFYYDESESMFVNELASRIRSYVSYMTGRDVELSGVMVDGVSIPISSGSALAFGITIPLPLSLRDELDELDGDVYKQGTERLKKGKLAVDFKNVSGSVALNGGTAVLSGLTIDIATHVDSGPTADKNYCGPTHRFQSRPALPAVTTEQLLPRAKRLGLLIDGTGSGSSYTLSGELKSNKAPTADFVAEFNRNRRRAGGDNTCARVVPLLFPRRLLTNEEEDFTPKTIYVKDESAPASQDFLDITHEVLNEKVKARVQSGAKDENGGNKVQQVAPKPPSLGSRPVPTRNMSKLGVHFVKPQAAA